MQEMEANQSFAEFQKRIEDGIQAQQEFEKLKEEEKDYMAKIKKINEDLKQKQDSNAKEAAESTEDITKYRKQLNETKTESQLQIEYTKREIRGYLQTLERQFSMVRTATENEIHEL